MNRLKNIIVALVAFVAAIAMVACGGKTGGSGKLEDSADSLSYVMGMNIAYNLMQMDSTLRADAVVAAISDVMSGKPKMTLEDGKFFLLSYMNYDVYERVRKYEEQYLEDLAASGEDIIRTRTGLTYKVGELGNMSNTATHPRDTVTIRYTAYNMAGKEVDLAAERADSVRTTLAKLQNGMAEGVKLVGQGGKITLWMPSELAYGPAGDEQKGIKPNEMLRYEVEIVEVKRRRR